MSDVLASYHAVFVLIGINAVLAYSMYAVLIAGQLSLAQGAFASIAAYTTALLTIEAGVAFPVVILIGLLVGAVAAILLGLPVLRLRGVFLAIATLGFGEVIRIFAINLSVTGGAQGLPGIPKIVGIPQVAIAVAASAWLFARLRGTRLGRGFAAIREDEIAAAVAGIDVVRYRMYSFAISGAVAGASGTLFAHFTRYISADQFGFGRALDALLYAIVGGTGHWAGPLLGAGFLTLVPEVQREFGFAQPWIRPAVSGGILLLVILFIPDGLVGVRRFWSSRSAPRAVTGTLEPAVVAPSTHPAPPDSADGPRRPDVSDVPGRDRSGDDGTLLARLRAVSKDYGGVVALNSVDLDLAHGEVVGLIGPNGAGKTTLVNIVTGVTPPSSGTVELCGRKLTPTTRVHEVAQAGVARTFQQVRLFNGLSVRDNVLIGAHQHLRPTFGRRLLALPSARRDAVEALTAADEALGVVGLADRASHPATSLSYGDRRRLEVARALASRPRLLVLDEPAAGMNHVEAARLGELIGRIAASGVSVLLVEHNVRLVMRTCTRVVVLDFGVVIADGSPGDVSSAPQVVAAYLGGGANEPEVP